MAERDIFAEETRRLQRVVQRLRALWKRMLNENKNCSWLKEKVRQLEETRMDLQGVVSVRHNAILLHWCNNLYGWHVESVAHMMDLHCP